MRTIGRYLLLALLAPVVAALGTLGLVVVERVQMDDISNQAIAARTYFQRSGHFNTVSTRRPKAYKKLGGKLSRLSETAWVRPDARTLVGLR